MTNTTDQLTAAVETLNRLGQVQWSEIRYKPVRIDKKKDIEPNFFGHMNKHHVMIPDPLDCDSTQFGTRRRFGHDRGEKTHA